MNYSNTLLLLLRELSRGDIARALTIKFPAKWQFIEVSRSKWTSSTLQGRAVRHFWRAVDISEEPHDIAEEPYDISEEPHDISEEPSIFLKLEGATVGVPWSLIIRKRDYWIPQKKSWSSTVGHSTEYFRLLYLTVSWLTKYLRAAGTVYKSSGHQIPHFLKIPKKAHKCNTMYPHRYQMC